MNESEKPYGCDNPASFSIVWPGLDRKYWCVHHALGVMRSARDVGISRDRLDMQPVTLFSTHGQDKWPICMSIHKYESDTEKT